MAVEAERTLSRKHQTLTLPADLDAAFQDFLRILGGIHCWNADPMAGMALPLAVYLPRGV
jgi:hypothetical protein